MQNKKNINWFFGLIAFPIGLTLMKHIDFKHFTLQKPALDTIYIVVFIACIFLMLKDLFVKK
jgi:hypothetical protein